MAVDKSIRVSLHGSGPSGFGLTKDGDVVSRNRIVAPYDNSKSVAHFDDFFGDLLSAEWAFVQGTSGTSTGVVTNNLGGALVLTTSATAGTTNANGTTITDAAQLTTGAFYNFTAVNGGLSIETRVKISAITSVSFFFGFTDVGTFELPVLASGTGNGISTPATNAVGILFDTAMTTANFWGVGVKADTDATPLNLGVAPVADTYVILKIEVDKSGAAKFFVNGQGRGGGVMSNAITSSAATVLCPTVAITTRTTAARVATIDYIDTRMDRY